MHDQANHLRALVSADRRAEPAQDSAPRLIALAGGKGGVGCTTLAIQLARALAQDGRRTLLVDADAQRPDVATLCQLDESTSIADVQSGRRTLHEAIRLGPGGIQILPGASPLARSTTWTPAGQDRFLAELRSLAAHADVAILDVGSACGATAHRFWQSADQVLLVTTPDQVAVLDAYAAIKSFWTAGGRTRLASIVNQATDVATAAEVHERLRQACRRFLAADLELAGTVPKDRGLACNDATLAMGVGPEAFAALARVAEHCAAACGERSRGHVERQIVRV